MPVAIRLGVTWVIATLGLSAAGLDAVGAAVSSPSYVPRDRIDAASTYDGTVLYDDFHYPAEEPTEHKQLRANTPTVLQIHADGTATLQMSGQTVSVAVGDIAFDTWHVVAVAVPAGPDAGFVAMEAKRPRWGLLVYVNPTGGVIAALRKPVGALASIVQPRFNFTGRNPAYFDQVANDPGDYASKVAANLTADGQFSFEGMASTLAPQRDIVALGNAADVVKMVLTHAGRVKCGKRDNTDVQNQGGIVELQDQHAVAPDVQTLLFDPAGHLNFWPAAFEHTKTGLVGGFLNVGNVGAFSPSVGKGFEMMAFVPAPPTPKGRSASVRQPSCSYTGPIANTFVPDYPSCAGRQFPDLASAQTTCNACLDCGGVTHRGGSYEMRQKSYTMPSPTGETSWLITNASKEACHALPRIAGLNYNPAVYIMLREQASATWGKGDTVRYFQVTNTSATAHVPPTPLNADEFYRQLLRRQSDFASLVVEGMSIRLPASDRRQVDMAAVGMLSGLNNYVGNQANYGFGATYWSYGREDNGSLPLNWLSVDDALVEWGICSVAKDHMAFFFDNYILPSGAVNYYTWGSKGDSVSVYGRLIDLYLKMDRLCDCATDSWAKRNLPPVEAIATYLLSLQAKQKAVPPPGYATGLLQGAPEHDWSGTTDLYFYNNNVWAMRGMQMLGVHLSSGLNSTLGAALLAGSKELKSAIEASVSQCSVPSPAGTFLPPYAEANATPYTSMVESHEASYSNFRFFSEPLLASVLPANVETGWLSFHNAVGGRLGGTSRWSTHLDDMPTAGWGFGALNNNQTVDFQALLYGQMATYQSRGSFHSTEQLSYLGEGRYRAFLHFADPAPDVTSQVAASPSDRVGTFSYFGDEQDVSFCIVSEVLVSRLTRWQLVFEDGYRDQAIWLGRGAPNRWFKHTSSDSAFAVSNAPTSVGRVSYDVSVDGSSATYNVTVATAGHDSSSVPWVVHFVGAADLTATCVQGCTVTSIDAPAGSVRVAISSPHFVVRGSTSRDSIIVLS